MDGSKTLLRRAADSLLTIALAFAAGVLLGLALPPRNTPHIGWFALAPLLVAAARARGFTAFGLGLIASIGAGWIVGRPWHTIEQFGNLAGAFGMLGLVFGCVAVGFSTFSRNLKPIPLCIVTACLGVVVEFVSEWLFPVNIAILQSDSLPILQIASITGVWGISFLIWLANTSFATAILQPRSAHLPALLLIFGMILYGWGSDRAANRPPVQSVTVAALQGMSIFDLANLTKQAASQGAKMVVWPELVSDGLDQGRNKISQDLGITLIMGYVESGRDGGPYNSAAVFDRGYYIGSARKTHLFGIEKKSYKRNNKQRIFAPRGLPEIGVAICFDTNYTDVTRRLARKGAEVVFVPNSDPFTPTGILHHLHSALMPIRAAENGVVIVRADSSGISQIVDSRGEVLASLPMVHKGMIIEKVPLGSGPTFYTRTGDWFVWISAAVSVYAASRCVKLKRRKKRTIPTLVT